ncbi:DLW-39 family protein [Micromonospora cathayae]|uniref:DLW-39 family protein n=1 Tax=Micromonospora cathayae TaxID=3028804 RepID=A0ABY7ZT13_9ACTN|nr:DLW-39 family protein [Micromonospora sp. HUAS 3]WDZ86040.1 DLW-39 family protein [Micromonospora sp. HUAS 3]
MIKKLLFLVGVVGVAVVVAQKIKASNDERALWHEATTAPDLR